MSTENHYRRAGEQLDDDLETLRKRLHDLEQSGTETDIDLEELADRIAQILEERREAGDGRDGYGDDYGNGGDGEKGGGEEPPPPPDETDVAERIDQLRYDVDLVVNPDAVELVETGAPSDGYHPHPEWGIIVSVGEPVHWRSAEIDAQEAGTVRLVIRDMTFVEGETYDLGDVHKTREIPVEAGQQTVPVELALPPGQYFITREDTTPMRRVLTDADWSELNDSHDIPLRIECSWQAGRTPDNEAAFKQYRENDWDHVLHYWAECEFGHMSSGS